MLSTANDPNANIAGVVEVAAMSEKHWDERLQKLANAKPELGKPE